MFTGGAKRKSKSPKFRSKLNRVLIARLRDRELRRQRKNAIRETFMQETYVPSVPSEITDEALAASALINVAVPSYADDFGDMSMSGVIQSPEYFQETFDAPIINVAPIPPAIPFNPWNLYFENQVSLHCSKHALNMAIQKPTYTIVPESIQPNIWYEDSSYWFINIQALCHDSNERAVQALGREDSASLLFECGCNNYDDELIQLALSAAGYKYDHWVLEDENQKARFEQRMAFYEHKGRSFVIHNLGEVGHFTALIYFNDQWFFMDSMAAGPQPVNYFDFWQEKLADERVRHVTVIKDQDTSGGFIQMYEDAVRTRIQRLQKSIVEAKRFETTRLRRRAEDSALTAEAAVAAMGLVLSEDSKDSLSRATAEALANVAALAATDAQRESKEAEEAYSYVTRMEGPRTRLAREAASEVARAQAFAAEASKTAEEVAPWI